VGQISDGAKVGNYSRLVVRGHYRHERNVAMVKLFG
jgi:hypothetical protein